MYCPSHLHTQGDRRSHAGYCDGSDSCEARLCLGLAQPLQYVTDNSAALTASRTHDLSKMR